MVHLKIYKTANSSKTANIREKNCLTPGDKPLHVLGVDGEGLVEALESLYGGAGLEVLDALVDVLEGPLARLFAPQPCRAPFTRELAYKNKSTVFHTVSVK